MDREETILDYFQGRLTPERRAAFEEEMAQDASLAAEVALLRSVREDMAQAPRHEKADQVWDRVSAEIDATPRAANDNRPLWKAALKYAAVVVLSVATWHVVVGPRLGPDPEGFRTASEDPAAFSVQVQFVQTASYGDIAALLASLGARITDGPSALGLVRLSFADADARQEALGVLEATGDLVAFVAE
ncbi:hypothetical protein PVW48_06180 [Dinoroseobacter sp. PD6]|uniref:anti-sigma factor family protein n=1 Tax=Dinoroseobacter sp. PD6 TaxID=3028384 RepID=UPI00237BF800|nr:hypothetical protein [Dinoroseobacter sp. PD6]MDD9716323.1 hypothetical protein [Dinoroseobacter sp. PD6]